MLTDEQRARLNPEQLVIAENWERERDERLAFCDKMSEADAAKDTVAYKAAFEGYLAVGAGATHCEHERSIWSNCAACDEISRLLNPDLFCSKCEEPFEEDELNLVQGICDYCSQKEDDG